MRIFKRLVLGAALTLLLSAAASIGQELQPDAIIAKHLDAVGKRSTVDQVQTLFALGLSSFESQSPAAKGGGKALVVSDKGDLMFAISLNSKDYPYEKIGYFNDKVSLPFISAGQRSLLGSFISEHPRVLTEGLFGGTMSRRWPLWNYEGSKSKIKSLGVKKVNGKKAYVLSYIPDGGGADEFTVKLYFDTDTFQHVRTEYHREYNPQQPQFGVANQLANSEITLTEDFSDFKTVDGLTLPYVYSVEFSSNANTSSFKTTWGVHVAQYYINQKLAPDFFTFDAK
jgi:hypothetical protein